jgi:peptidoglycan/LPS O-acetylase OafA/YrhL
MNTGKGKDQENASPHAERYDNDSIFAGAAVSICAYLMLPSIRTTTGRRYYPGLSGLRAIAALTVLFSHVGRMRQIHGMPALMTPAFNSFIGGMAVTFFFALSGFLITSLLLQEKARERTIRVKDFLINRALRIWPLYYVTLAAGYAISIFLLGETDANPLRNGLLLNLLLLPNLAFVFNRLPEILIQLWSIGTEEQFYLVWPFLIRRFSVRKLAWLFLALILFWGTARMPFQLLEVHADRLNAFLFRTRIDCMAIGGLAALLLFRQENGPGWWTTVYRLLLRPVTGWVSMALFLLLLGISRRYDISLYQLYAGLFALCCLRVSQLPVRWLEWPPLRYLGRISYGFYLLHHFVLYFLFRTWFAAHPAGTFVIFLSAGLLTTGVAAVSYSFFERLFLRKKIMPPVSSPGPILS